MGRNENGGMISERKSIPRGEGYMLALTAAAYFTWNGSLLAAGEHPRLEIIA